MVKLKTKAKYGKKGDTGKVEHIGKAFRKDYYYKAGEPVPS